MLPARLSKPYRALLTTACGALITLSTLAACSSSTSEPGIRPALLSLPRPLSSSEQQVQAAANAFSFALWQQVNLSPSDANVFVSPLSASFALGMAMNGASGQTFDEMRSALRYSNVPIADVDAGYKSLIELLTTLDPSVTLGIANSVWYRNSFSFNKSFLDATATWFGATTTPLDFNDAPGSLARINDWSKQKTNGIIPSILDAIHPDDVMFLLNAIYFKAGWRDRFDPGQTNSAPFHGSGGDRSVSLMHRYGKASYTEAATFQAVDLSYGDSAFTMTVILPKAGVTVADVATSLTLQSWSSIAAGFHTAQVDLYLPKFRIEWERALIPDLQALGMKAAFVPNGADFSAMSPAGRSLYISLVKQKTYVNVDEEGTEAAAVTAVGVSVTSAPVTVNMRVDRPFIFAIRERLTGTVLFMGKIVRLP